MQNRGSLTCAVLATLYLSLQSPAHCNAQSQGPGSKVVVEATDVTYGIGHHKDEHLLVRLTSDGKVVWDKWAGKSWQREATTVPAEKVSLIQRRFDAIDKTTIGGKMGPYNVYTDTFVELQVGIGSPGGEHRLSIINPWPGLKLKPLPKEVKSIVCEVSRLRSQVAGEPLEQMCLPSRAPHR